jgi:hypothetical protein
MHAFGKREVGTEDDRRLQPQPQLLLTRPPPKQAAGLTSSSYVIGNRRSTRYAHLTKLTKKGGRWCLFLPRPCALFCFVFCTAPRARALLCHIPHTQCAPPCLVPDACARRSKGALGIARCSSRESDPRAQSVDCSAWTPVDHDPGLPLHLRSVVYGRGERKMH